MIEFAIAAFFYVGTVGILASLIYFQGERDSKARQGMDLRMQEEREAWAEERQTLLERIQRPEYRPPEPRQVHEPETQVLEQDLSLIGTVVSGEPEADDE